MLLAVYLLNGTTLLVALATGVACLKKHSRFPDTRVGYHMEQAMTDEKSWDRANEIAGRLCLWGGLLGFFIIPALLRLLSVHPGVMLSVYFAVALCFILLVVLLPAQMIRGNRKNSK